MSDERIVSVDFSLFFYSYTAPQFRLALREASDEELAEALKDTAVNRHPKKLQRVQAAIARREKRRARSAG